MKIKKHISLCAIALSVSCLGGCASGSLKTSFSNYWNQNALVFEQIHETLVYDVMFEKGATYGYELTYDNGTYTTELKSGADKSGQNIYTYTTELSIDVTYTFGEESKTFTDIVKTEVSFLPAESGLRPLASKKSIVSSSPVTSKPTKLDECYRAYAYELSTVYTENGGETTLVNDKNVQTQNFTIDGNGYSYLDNEQLLLSLRAISTRTTSTNFLAYSPFTDRVQKVAVSFSSAESGDFEFYKNGSAEKITQTISYRPVQIQLNESNSGFAQKVWIASTTTSDANTYRNVMLRLETPLYQGLGTLVYQLSSASYQ